MTKDILLNHAFLKNRVTELGIKQWWLAEQVGVDRKTIIRWMQGQVKSIQVNNAENLAKVLECSLDDLTVSNEAEQLATAEDQKIAANLLVSSSLVEKLGPIGEWNVIEALLKASIGPNLPLNILGELYDQLTVTSWRQSKIDQAAIYNAKTEELATKSGDKPLLAAALLSKANIFSWRGFIAQSIATYRECINLERYIEVTKLAAAYSNLGAVLYESGDLEEGKSFVRKSLKLFEKHGKPTNLSITHCHLALIALQQNQLEIAQVEVAASIQYANQDEYRRGQHMGKLIQAEIAARSGQSQDAQRLVAEALQEFEKMGIVEGLNFEFAGRVYRLIGQFDQAEKYLGQGIRVAQKFPMYLAALHVEMGLVLKAKGDSDWSKEIQVALDIYTQAGCPLRMAMLKAMSPDVPRL